MKSISPQIRVVSAEFAKRIIDKSATFSTKKTLKNLRKRISTFLGSFNLVFAFPLIVIKRTSLLLEKTRIAVPAMNSIIINAYFKGVFASNLVLTSYFDQPTMTVFEGVHRLPKEILRRKQDMVISFPRTTPLQADQKGISPYVPVQVVPFLNENSTHVSMSPDALSSDLNLSSYPLIVNEAKFRTLFLDKSRRLNSQKVIEVPLRILSRADKRLAIASREKHRQSTYEFAPSEHVIRVHPQIIRETKERIVEKEKVSPQQAKPLSFDVNRLADQVYQLIERKVRIERERRGL